ncbi:MAG: type II secretion system protein [Myxococcota bacterium]
MHRRSAFTLVELLIVVIILGILASVAVSQFSDSSDDAKQIALKTNLGILRDAIERYYVDHGHYPGAVRSGGTCAVGTNTDTGTPGSAAFVGKIIADQPSYDEF